MRYLLLIYGDESSRQEVSPEEQAEQMGAWNGYTGWLREKGWYIGGEALQPTSASSWGGTT